MRHLKYDKNCLYCNKQFIATRDDARFCSAACKAAHRRKRSPAEELLREQAKFAEYLAQEKGTGGQVDELDEAISQRDAAEKLVRKLIRSLKAEVERRKAIKSTEINGNDSK